MISTSPTAVRNCVTIADAPGQRPPDSHPSLGDDMGYDDPGDSPTDGDDLHSPEAMSDIHRSRLGHDLHHNDKYRQPTSRASPYSYPSHDSRSTSTHEPRVSYDASLGGRQEGSYGQQAHTSTLHYTYPSAQSNGHSQTQSMNTFSQSSLDTRSDWNLRPSPWLGTEQSQDRSFTALSAPKAERPLTSPSWNRSSLPSSNPAPSSLTLPTLSSPFFPTDTSHPLSPQSSSQSISTSYGSSHMHSPSLAGREFGHHEISISPGPPLSIAPQYHSGSDRSGLMHVPRHWEGPRALPPISNYSQLHPPFSPLSASGGQQAYWAKD
ncbi:hypothetical protein H0H87_006750 [Tephrocybe sp. NHM501043]|nr:hypothetical protein H0H87_006750 [Tephrocybe sp. NHM501043]